MNNPGSASPEAPAVFRETIVLHSWMRKIFGLVLLVGALPSSADVLPPTLVPAAPGVGDVVGFQIVSSVCDGFLGNETPVPVTRNGTSLRVFVTSIHTVSPFCLFPLISTTYRTTTFPPGSYTLQIDRSYQWFSGGTVVETVGVIPFTVTGPPQEVPIPALGVPALLLLALGLAIFTRKHLAH